MDFLPNKLKISTMTVTSNLGTNVNIRVLGKFLKLNENIKEIKYYNFVKKDNQIVLVNNKRTFYNQITVVIYGGEYYINMKIFSNGQVQMTGCKDEKSINKVLDIIKKEIYNINNVYCVNVYIENGLVIGYDNHIYIKNNIIGYKKDENYYIFYNEEVKPYKNGYFITIKSYSKIKHIYNNLGENVGSQYIVYNNKYNKKYNNIMNDVLYNNNNKIGYIKTDIENDKLFEWNGITKFISKFMVVEQGKINMELYKIANINSVYDINMSIDRHVLHRILLKKNIVSKFDPNTYPGVNIKYIYNEKQNGICNCITKCKWANKKIKNKCDRISIFVFQSGKIMITGGNTYDKIEQAYNFLNTVIKDNIKELYIINNMKNLEQYMDKF